MMERKLFLQIQSINIVYASVKNRIVVPLTNIAKITESTQDCIISWMNFDYKENGLKKSFSCKHQYRVS